MQEICREFLSGKCETVLPLRYLQRRAASFSRDSAKPDSALSAAYGRAHCTQDADTSVALIVQQGNETLREGSTLARDPTASLTSKVTCNPGCLTPGLSP